MTGTSSVPCGVCDGVVKFFFALLTFFTALND